MAGEALLSTVRRIWATLKELQVDAALMGGIAVAAWEHLRNTRDVDLLIAAQPDVDAGMLEGLLKAGFRPIRDPPWLILGSSRVLQLAFEPPGKSLDVRIDLFAADSEFHRRALSRRIELPLPGVDNPVFVLSCEDLILFKLLAGRLIDRSDCAHLLRLNRERLDQAYLQEWSARLDLSQALAEIWSEAFPGEEWLAAGTTSN